MRGRRETMRIGEHIEDEQFKFLDEGSAVVGRNRKRPIE